MEDLSRLSRRRAANRTFVNKTLEKIDQQLEDYTDDKSKKAKLKAFRDTLNEKLGVLTELNSKILDQLDEKDFQKEIDETSELKMTIQERIVNIELAIRTDSSESEDDGDIDSVRSSSRASSSKKTKRLTQTVKLPKLVIKKFGGNHAEYQAFWDSFDAAIQASRVSRFRFLGNALWDRRSRKVSTNSRISAITEYSFQVRISLPPIYAVVFLWNTSVTPFILVSNSMNW